MIESTQQIPIILENISTNAIKNVNLCLRTTYNNFYCDVLEDHFDEAINYVSIIVDGKCINKMHILSLILQHNWQIYDDCVKIPIFNDIFQILDVSLTNVIIIVDGIDTRLIANIFITFDEYRIDTFSSQVIDVWYHEIRDMIEINDCYVTSLINYNCKKSICICFLNCTNILTNCDNIKIICSRQIDISISLYVNDMFRCLTFNDNDPLTIKISIPKSQCKKMFLLYAKTCVINKFGCFINID